MMGGWRAKLAGAEGAGHSLRANTESFSEADAGLARAPIRTQISETFVGALHITCHCGQHKICTIIEKTFKTVLCLRGNRGHSNLTAILKDLE